MTSKIVVHSGHLLTDAQMKYNSDLQDVFGIFEGNFGLKFKTRKDDTIHDATIVKDNDEETIIKYDTGEEVKIKGWIERLIEPKMEHKGKYFAVSAEIDGTYIVAEGDLEGQPVEIDDLTWKSEEFMSQNLKNRARNFRKKYVTNSLTELFFKIYIISRKTFHFFFAQFFNLN